MKSKIESYKERVLGYYGKKKKPEVSRQKSYTITKCFDDGISINLSLGYQNDEFLEYEVAHSLDPFIEYDIAQSVEEFVEYEVVSAIVSRDSMAFQESVDFDTAYSLEDLETKKKEDQLTFGGTQCYCDEKDNKENEQTSYGIEPARVQKEKQKTPAKEGIPESLSDLFNDLSDDDFMTDMKSILRGQKVYDEKTRKAVPNGHIRKVATEQGILNVKDIEPEIKPLDQKNEHAIFDKIANSMKFANAYDLGSMDLEKRFDEFDQIQEWGTSGNNKKKVDSAPKQEPVRAEAAPVTDYADFIEDLDLIKEASGKAEIKQQDGKITADVEGKDAPENPA